MGTALQEIRASVDRIGQISTAFPPWGLLVGDMGRLARTAREYADFAHALAQCRESAREEFTYIRERIGEVETIGREAAGGAFPPPQTDLDGLTDSEGEQYLQTHAQARRRFDEFKDAFADEFGRLEATLARTAAAGEEFKVVLFGRTGVGKSTIREALTCGDGETIGRGASSTTKECHEYTWRKILHVWDTPGIDSRKDVNIDERGVGDEERAALEKLEAADIAVFVFKTKPLELKEREWFRKVVESGRPFVVLLNVAASIQRYSLFKKRGGDRNICREKQGGCIGDIVKELSPDEKRRAEENTVVVHALACFYSRARKGPKADAFFAENDVTRGELYRLSRFGDFRDYLTKFICGEGCRARRDTIDRTFVAQVGAFAGAQGKKVRRQIDQIDRDTAELRKAADQLHRQAGAWSGNRLERKFADALNQYLAIVSIARRCIDDGIRDVDIEVRWKKCLSEAILQARQVLVEDFQGELKRTFRNLGEALEFNSGFLPAWARSRTISSTSKKSGREWELPP